ncbi:sodium/proline symporter [Microbulbifer sp. OS29]|uniref:Sodium/proline symporter n=1 Tax=Microbulbifer okhotskensis TaxID=2926617 RepID=A0A9X2J816_9GAMM|nr:sodium/proline symporter [Microbulbifer okhotskensis]MCO1335071.1 sodium/proline symporter [Microbulbifer okhotskensis]
MIYSFMGFLLLFTLVGVSSALFSRGTKADYYLASRGTPPWLVGLSAVATNNSGYMFIGVIGYTYMTGLASIWLMVGWIAGDFIASLYVHKRMRRATSASGEVSYAGVLSNWYGQKHSVLQRLIGIISLLFLLTYASAQLVAGSKALHVLLDWPLWSGAVVGALLVCLYCLTGGIRASIWTDAAQSIVMIGAMGTLLAVALTHLGGVSSAIEQMQAIEGFTGWFPRELVFPGWGGVALFVGSWFFAGLSVIGQPHVMVRFMTLDDSSKMHHARAWYYLWFILFYAMATGVGLLSRVFIVDIGSFDAELALPTMAMELLPPLLVGLILAGIFAATMSTADSLLLNCSAAITHDILPRNIEKTWLLKLVTVAITGGALLLSLANSQSVFSLVLFAWSGLASAFGPLLLVLCFGGRPSQATCITAVVAGFAMAIAWRLLELHSMIYEGLPGITAGLLVFYLANLVRRPMALREINT